MTPSAAEAERMVELEKMRLEARREEVKLQEKRWRNTSLRRPLFAARSACSNNK